MNEAEGQPCAPCPSAACLTESPDVQGQDPLCAPQSDSVTALFWSVEHFGLEEKVFGEMPAT